MTLRTCSRYVNQIAVSATNIYHFQCSIPVFDGLLNSSNNVIIMDLLFELSTWDGLTKLCLHTKSTVCALESSTTQLGVILRKFQSTTCAEFATQDLPSEEALESCQNKASDYHTKTKIKIKRKWEGQGQAITTQALYFRAFKLQNPCTARLPKDLPRVGNY